MFPLYDINPTRRTPLVVFAIVAANVVIFLWTQQLSPIRQQVLAYERGFVPARMAQLTSNEPLRVPLITANQQQRQAHRLLELPPDRPQILFSLFSCIFLHGGWLHLLGNMWFLWIFGNNVEDRLGSLLFIVLYLVGGLMASAAYWMTDPGSRVPVIGASGAVAAVLGAYAITWPWARVRTLVILIIFVTLVDVPAVFFLGIWFVLQVFSGMGSFHHEAGAGVAWWAHIGGFLAGMVLMPLFRSLLDERDRKPPPDSPHELEQQQGGEWGW